MAKKNAVSYSTHKSARGNTWATADEVDAESSKVARARDAAMDSIRRRTVTMIRNSESGKPPEHKPRTIDWLIQRWCAGELCIHGVSQRGMVCKVKWARQFVSMLLNSSISVPAITLRKVIEPKDVNGRTVMVDVYYVTDGAQRLTAILWFWLGLLDVEVIDEAAPRRSARNLSKKRKEGGVEENPLGDADKPEEYSMRFYDTPVNLMGLTSPRFPMVYTPVDKDGNALEADEDVPDDHKDWALDYSGANNIYADTAPKYVKDFFDKYVIALETGSAYCSLQGEDTLVASQAVRLRFLSREIGVDETTWSQQAGSHVNLWQSLQQYFFGVSELVCLVGDLASEWLKTLVPDLVEITDKWGVGHDMQLAYGAMTRAFVMIHGARRVPVQEDGALWVFVLDYLGEHFLSSGPGDRLKRRFAAAVRNITACNVPKRKDTRLNSDEVAIMIAMTCNAIDDRHVPDDIDEKCYREAIISKNDRAILAGAFAVMKAKGAKQKAKKLKERFSLKKGLPEKLAKVLNSALTEEGKRNLAGYVGCMNKYICMDKHIGFESHQYEDEDEDEDEEEDEPAQAPASNKRSADDDEAAGPSSPSASAAKKARTEAGTEVEGTSSSPPATEPEDKEDTSSAKKKKTEGAPEPEAGTEAGGTSSPPAAEPEAADKEAKSSGSSESSSDEEEESDDEANTSLPSPAPAPAAPPAK